MRASATYVKVAAQSFASAIRAKVSTLAIRASAIAGEFIFVLGAHEALSAIDFFSMLLTKARSDQASALDTLFKSISKPLSDNAFPSDSISKTPGKSFSDAVSYDDSYVRSFTKGVNDAVGVTDDTNGAAAGDDQTVSFFKVLSDSPRATDVLLRAVDYIREYADTATSYDSAAKLISKTLEDTVSVLESIGIGRELTNASADAASTTDSGFGISQSYCGGDYFAEDYVGVKVTF